MSTVRKRPVVDQPAVEAVNAAPSRLKVILAHALDVAVVAGFLALAFLLGVFPMKDTDFWWHLRTGDLIRSTWRVPVTDWYTFGAEGHEWIDLHWGFEVLLSLGYGLGGIPALTLAKCVVTCAGLLVLLVARRREWPLWVAVLAWLPALLVLGGRMYVRPETLSFLYLAVFLWVVFFWRDRPRLAWILPPTMVLWVNTQGLFVLGGFTLACGLIDAALRWGAFAKERRRWWRTVLSASIATGLACVLNPYGLRGAVFPIALARTMTADVFSKTIGELKPLDDFIAEMGLSPLPLRLHLATMALGGLSFVVPVLWSVFTRSRRDVPVPPPAPRKKKKADVPAKVELPTWSPSVFRLLMFLAFSALSWRATRNSHQFAAVVGTITAWNLAEWLAVLRARRAVRTGETRVRLAPRLATLGVLAALVSYVGSGAYYAAAREGRTIGWGEPFLWFPHAASKFAGGPGMPDRFVCIHNGLAGLFEYDNGPAKKVYADARLEVMGPEIYGDYVRLTGQLEQGDPAGLESLRALGDPGLMVDVLVDHMHPESTGTAATLLTSSRYRLVWLDPLAAVFVPTATPAASKPFDFSAALFEPDAVKDLRLVLAWTKTLQSLSLQLSQRNANEHVGPVATLGASHARRLREEAPNQLDGWKYGGLIESLRDPVGSVEAPIARYAKPFDPVFDALPCRAIYLLRETLERAPDDMKTLVTLALLYQSHGMDEQALPTWKHVLEVEPVGQRVDTTEATRRMAMGLIEGLTKRLGPEPSRTWKNQAELDTAVRRLLDSGRPAAAADLLEEAYPSVGRPWEVTDRLATLRLHLGRPDLARNNWTSAEMPPRPALVKARAALCDWMLGDDAAARTGFADAVALEPRLFEAHYGLALLERDAGRRAETAAAARAALGSAPTDAARRAAEALLSIAAAH